jgi:hypothetical protein
MAPPSNRDFMVVVVATFYMTNDLHVGFVFVWAFQNARNANGKIKFLNGYRFFRAKKFSSSRDLKFKNMGHSLIIDNEESVCQTLLYLCTPPWHFQQLPKPRRPC